MASSLLFTLSLLISLFSYSLSSPLSSETILDASEILADTGYLSMSLTLELISDTLFPNSHSLTIFAPSDPAFMASGQPSLPLLQFHFSPFPMSLETLKSLPYGTEIPTMFQGHSLTVTSSPSDDHVSLNNVDITPLPIFDDGFLIIYGTREFFDPDFEVTAPESSFGCGFLRTNSFGNASEALRSGGYSLMAGFLDFQVLETKKSAMMTLFAPTDQVLGNRLGNFSEYSSIFLRHVVPCRLLWTDLVKFNDGAALPTQLGGFSINITRSGGGILMLNGVPVYYPNIYISDWLVVHGLRQVLAVPWEGTQEGIAGASDEFGGSIEDYTPDYEF
ncbi:hypothetical protein ACB098_08G169100 [Castanea mollissima]